MTIALLGTFVSAALGWLMGFLSLFLILLVLIQRGKGGGLTGALGGPGGQSAFGSKAGDTFTVITIVTASIWGFTCAFTMWLLGTHTPTRLTETEVQAGPGDDEPTTTLPGDAPVAPTGPGGGIGGIPGLELPTGDGAELEEESGEPQDTPSFDLTPANPDATTESAAETPEPTAETPEDDAEAADETAAPEPDSAPEPDPVPEADTVSEQPPAEVDAESDAAENEAAESEDAADDDDGSDP